MSVFPAIRFVWRVGVGVVDDGFGKSSAAFVMFKHLKFGPLEITKQLEYARFGEGCGRGTSCSRAPSDACVDDCCAAVVGWD